MSRRVPHILASVACLIVASLTLYACGDSGAGQDEVEHAANQNQTRAPTSAPNPGSSGGSTSCGGTLTIGPNTTCGFAANVEADYYSKIGSGPGTVHSYNLTPDRYFKVHCTGGSPHRCTGANGTSVYFP
jgi:hypothetical protein